MQGIDRLESRDLLTEKSTNGFGDLTSDQFVEIMFAELRNQDPLKPSDSQAMLDQLSSLRSIESDLQFGKRLDQLVDGSDFSTASSLIGRVVSGITTESEQIIDTIFSVSKTSQGPVLNLSGGKRMKLDDIIEIAIPQAMDGE
jgi:flagellar basal-body rod modification protein FlgD